MFDPMVMGGTGVSVVRGLAGGMGGIGVMCCIGGTGPSGVTDVIGGIPLTGVSEFITGFVAIRTLMMYSVRLNKSILVRKIPWVFTSCADFTSRKISALSNNLTRKVPFCLG